jgi:hypothetical protein
MMKQKHREFRTSKRHSVLTGARIALADGSILGGCRMFDLSSGGARLEVKKEDVVPDQFILLLSHDGRLFRQCSVVWRQETTIGVEFIPNYPQERR